MSGMNVSGQILVQEARGGGFEVSVYPTRLDAAIQLLRTEIRRSAVSDELINKVEADIAFLIASERADLEE